MLKTENAEVIGWEHAIRALHIWLKSLEMWLGISL